VASWAHWPCPWRFDTGNTEHSRCIKIKGMHHMVLRIAPACCASSGCV